MSRKPTLSPTRIAAYLECAVRYRYIYIDRIGRFYMRSRPELSFGSTLHQVLRAYHAAGATQTAGEMLQQYERHWVAAGYESATQEEQFREAGVGIVRSYHAASAERAAAGVETLLTEKTIRADLGRFALIGRVDRVDRHPDGTLEVVDYKSGRMSVTPEEVAGDLALRIYQLILRRTRPDSRVIATLYCLRSGGQASAGMADEEAERFAADIAALGDQILDRDFDTVEPVPVTGCARCEFLPRCERSWRRSGLPARPTREEAPDN